MKLSIKAASAGLLALCISAGPAHADAFKITFEDPGVQNTTATFTDKGVTTFDNRSTGSNQTFTTHFGGSDITGVYTGIQINNADIYGGAGGSGKYAVTFGDPGYTLDLSTTNPNGVNYFGFWLSALDSGNQVSISRGGTTLLTFDPGNVLDLIGSTPAYYGNPNGGGNNQPYVFLNFFDTEGTFDKVSFFESPQNGGYESDNHTVGFATSVGGTAVPVPEPAAWAFMISGFGAIGGFMRRKQGVTASFA